MKKQIQVAALIRYAALNKMWQSIGLNWPERMEMLELGKMIRPVGCVQ